MTCTPAHLDYAGWVVVNDDLTELNEGTPMPMAVALVDPAEWPAPPECDFCPGAAVYVVEATKVLGPDAGWDVLYCQRDLVAQIDASYQGLTTDTWYSPTLAARLK